MRADTARIVRWIKANGLTLDDLRAMLRARVSEREKQRRYYQKDKAKYRARQKRWRLKNPEKWKATAHRYYLKHRKAKTS